MKLMPTMRKYDYFFDTHCLARTAFLNCHEDLSNVFVKTVIKDTFAFDCFTRAISPFLANLYEYKKKFNTKLLSILHDN